MVGGGGGGWRGSVWDVAVYPPDKLPESAFFCSARQQGNGVAPHVTLEPFLISLNAVVTRTSLGCPEIHDVAINALKIDGAFIKARPYDFPRYKDHGALF